MDSAPIIPDHEIHLPAIGEGTYGTVYRATYRGTQERAVKVFRRRVLNLMQMQRELEKISLAAEHPNVVTLYGFDLTHQPPYCAMGLHADRGDDGRWHGRTLDGLCGKTDGAETERLLTLVADALGYLHSIQVLHCDVKPANVLLTDESPPRPVLCDFGQSRASGSGLDEVAGSPCYAAPEQLRQPSDSAGGKGYRWDVYGFGVLAFRLATGRYPRLGGMAEEGAEASADRTLLDEGDGSRADEIAAKIEAAGDAVDWGDAALSKDWREVIERCLRLDPTERFADMREVREELSRRTQARRLRRARKVAFGFAGLAGVAIIAGAVAVTQWRNSVEARRQAEAARSDAEALAGSMLYDLGDKLRPLGRLDLMTDVSDSAKRYFDNLPDDQRTPESDLQRVAMLNNRGEILHAAGRLQEAGATLDEASALLDELERLYLGTSPEPENPPLDQLEHERLSNHLLKARVRRDLGETAEAIADLDRFLPEAVGGGSIPQWIALHQIHGDLLEHEGQPEESLAALRRALELARRMAEEAGNPVTLRLLSVAEAKVGASLLYRERIDEAEPRFVASLDALESIPAEARSGEWDGDMAATLATLSDISRLTGKADEARQRADRAVAILRQRMADDPLSQSARLNLASALGKRAIARMGEDGNEPSLADLRESLEILEPVVAIDPSNQAALSNRATTAGQITNLLMIAGRNDEAVEASRRQVDFTRALFKQNEDLLENRVLLVEALTRRSMLARPVDLAAAAEASAEAVRLAEAFGTASQDLWQVALAEGNALSEKAECELAAGRGRPAAELWEKAHALYRQANRPYHASLALLYRADALGQSGEEAAPHFQRAEDFIKANTESLTAAEVELLKGFLPGAP